MKSTRAVLSVLAAIGSALPLVLSATAQAQQYQAAQVRRFFPAGVMYGKMTFGEPPHVSLEGTPENLAAGTRIRNERNLIVLSGTLTGQTHLVNYVRGPSGELREIWILTAEERAEIAADERARNPNLIRPRDNRAR